MLRLAADIGGTFTDVVAYDLADGAVAFAKAPSTPQEPARGVLDALAVLAAQRGEPLPAMLARAENFLHGTTVATNTLAEGTGPRAGLLTTRGFRDVLELREGTKQDRYALRTPFPEALIPREYRLEVSERIGWDGVVREALDEDGARAAIAALKAEGVEVLVVGLLHAHANPAHERRLAGLVEESGWAGPIVLSHQILNRQGEYQRFSTAAVNAIVTPRLAGYLRKLEAGLIEAAGKPLPVMIMQSSGGLLPAPAASAFGVGCVTSGPAGGAIASAFLTRSIEGSHAVAFDIGGTTTDISLIEDGRAVERLRTDSDAHTIAIPSIDIRVEAIGGGSIASVDAGGVLSVGPRSSGAMPGPAAYGRGGQRATVTDAAVVLGYLAEGAFMGGRLPLSRKLAAEVVMRDVAEPLGLSLEDAARAIYRLAATKVAEGVRATTVGRGIDPRDLALIGFGGAGGLYMDLVARELEMETAIAPRAASVLSAFGFLAAPVRFDDGRTLSLPLRGLDPATLRETFAGMVAVLSARLADAGFPAERQRFEYRLDCRYIRQVGTVEVLSSGDESLDAIAENFARRYEALYGHRHPGEVCVIENCRVSAIGLQQAIDFPAAAGTDTPDAALRGHRRVFGDHGWEERPVYGFEELAPGAIVTGPALLESTTTTIVVEAGSTVTIDRFGGAVLRPAIQEQGA